MEYNAKEVFERLTKGMDAEQVARIKAIMKEHKICLSMLQFILGGEKS